MEPLEGIYIQQVACGLGHTLFIARDEESDRALLDKIPVYDPDKVRLDFRNKRYLSRANLISQWEYTCMTPALVRLVFRHKLSCLCDS